MKKIPDNAKKVFEGVIFDVYHWEQEMFDGTFATFEALKKRDSVTVVATVGDKIVLNNEEQPGRDAFITLPGGMCEKEETPLENAKRELLEETGLTTDDWELWFISDPWMAAKVDWNNYFYIARNCKKTSEPKFDSGERIETKYVTFEEFLELRNNTKNRNKDLNPILQTASEDEGERKKLHELLFKN